MANDGSLIFDTKLDTKGFDDGIKKLGAATSDALGDVKKQGAAASNALGDVKKQGVTTSKTFKAIKKGALAASAAIVTAGVAAINLASDLDEVQNVVDVTFGSGAKEIDKFADTAIKKFGLSDLSAKQFSSTMGAMLKSMGLASDQVLDMSINLAGLAGDMASFYNIDPTTAFEKLRAGISGETEPLKQLGINMSVANLEAYALSKGIKTAYDEMTQAQQATLRYNYIMSVTADAQGDFARTSDGFANQTRILKEQIKKAAASLAKELLPAATNIIAKINDAVESFSNLSDSQKQSVINIGLFIAASGPLVNIISGIAGAVKTLKAEIFGAEGLFGKLSGAAASAGTSLGVVGAGLVALGGAIYATSEAFDGSYIDNLERAGEKTAELSTGTAKLVSSTDELLDSANKAAKEAKNQGAAADTLYNKLNKLMSVEKKSASTKAQINSVVDELNAAVPDLSLAYDANADALNMSTTELRKNIDAMKKSAEAAAYQEKINDLTKARVDIEIQLASVDEELTSVTTRLADARAKAAAGDESAIGEIHDLTAAQEILIDQEIELHGKHTELESKINDVGAAMDSTAESSTTMSQSLEYQKSAATEAGESYEELAKVAEDANKNIASQYEALKEKVSSVFDKMKKEQAQSVKDMTKNLESNTEDTRRWTENIKILVERGVNEGIIQQLIDAGPEVAAETQNLVDASDEELKKLEDAYRENITVAQEAAVLQIGSGEIEAATKAQIAKNSAMVRDSDELENAVETSVNDAVSAGENAASSASSIGESIVSNIANSVLKLKGKITGAVSRISNVSGGGSVYGSWNHYDGSHASGLEYVPFDGYVAQLHKGEMVVPAYDAQKLRDYKVGGQQLFAGTQKSYTINNTFNSPKALSWRDIKLQEIAQMQQLGIAGGLNG